MTKKSMKNVIGVAITLLLAAAVLINSAAATSTQPDVTLSIEGVPAGGFVLNTDYTLSLYLTYAHATDLSAADGSLCSYDIYIPAVSGVQMTIGEKGGTAADPTTVWDVKASIPATGSPKADLFPALYASTTPSKGAVGDGKYLIGKFTVKVTSDTANGKTMYIPWGDTTGYLGGGDPLLTATDYDGMYSMVGDFSGNEANPITTAPITIAVSHAVTITNGTAKIDGSTEAYAASTAAADGMKVLLKADTPAQGKQFKQWTVTAGGVTVNDTTAAETYFMMGTADAAVTAEYEDIVYTVTATDGTASPASGIYGTSVTLTANAPATGKEFDKWECTSTPAVTFADATSASTTFTIPYGNVEVRATYKDIVYTVTATDGTASPASGIYGTSVTLTADTPAAGKEFDTWVCTSTPAVTFADATSASTTFTIPYGDVAVKATYKDIVYTVTATDGTASPASGIYGTSVSLTANAPATGKEFDKWECTSTPAVTFADAASASTTFTIPYGNVAVKAAYKDIDYTVTVTDGSANPNPAHYTDTVTITATDKADSLFKQWDVTAGTITLADAASASTTFTMPAENVAVAASYNLLVPDKLTVKVTPNLAAVETPVSIKVYLDNSTKPYQFPDTVAYSVNITNPDSSITQISGTTPDAVTFTPLVGGTYSIKANTNALTSVPVTLTVTEGEVVTITFNANGGNGTMDPQTIEKNVSTALNPVTFTKTGYTFAGWAKSASGSVVYADKASVTLDKDTTLYAVWTSNPTPTPTRKPSSGSSGGSGDTGSGHYTQYDRQMSKTDSVSFGTSQVVTSLTFSEPVSGSVTLNYNTGDITDTVRTTVDATTGEIKVAGKKKAPVLVAAKNGYMYTFYDTFKIEGGAKLPLDKVNSISFKVPLSALKSQGFTQNDVILYHGDEKAETWIPLDTYLESTDKTYAYYHAETNGASPFAVVFMEDKSIADGKTETASAEPTAVKTQAPITTTTSAPVKTTAPTNKPTATQTPASPVPVAGLLAGLGLAGLLFGSRRE